MPPPPSVPVRAAVQDRSLRAALRRRFPGTEPSACVSVRVFVVSKDVTNTGVRGMCMFTRRGLLVRVSVETIHHVRGCNKTVRTKI